MNKLFTPYDLSGIKLKNRVVMAPMTRTRTLTNVANEFTAEYYAQRASAGLLITEGLPVSDEARGYLYTPGIYTDEHLNGWRQVTDAVHAKGGKIFAQLWHVGRMSHVSVHGLVPVSSGTQPAVDTTVYAWVSPNEAGPVQPSVPRALRTEEIKRVIADFVKSARMAMDAGFDGIEIMAANGFLFDQFLSSALNTRTDQYGGSIANRQRFLLETLDAIADEIGGARIGVRFSPFGRLYDFGVYEGEAETWMSMAAALNERELAYVHLNYQPTLLAAQTPPGFGAALRAAYKGTLMAAGGFTQALAEAELAKGELDLIAFGTAYIANPDLVERMQNGWPLAASDRATYYGVGDRIAEGYTDYPAFLATNT
ncbi:alkene reductase [Pseudomonas hamedanensis]|uniref:Alkene reductase n=1 Tax=Pseudomonas hamedanensis TaxID=2745504 RepID=A0A9E6P0R8_9PSED|nr:alkene reductase [Pseudomonas hamedanensis]QXI17924.1 alkene reductase [Pseudomonas hamedanensis]